MSQSHIQRHAGDCAHGNKLCVEGDPKLLGQCIVINANGLFEQSDIVSQMSVMTSINSTDLPIFFYMSTEDWKYGHSTHMTRLEELSRYSFTLEKTIYRQLPEPYSECVEDNSSEALSSSMLSGIYTHAKCVATCNIHEDLHKCGTIKNVQKMFMRDDEYKNQLRNSTIEDLEKCTGGRKESKRVKECRKNCRQPCQREKFHVHERFHSGVRSNMLAVDVSFTELMETVIVDQPIYDEQTLFANFGGTLGLMTGMSALSLIEMFVWVSLCALTLAIGVYQKWC